MVILTCFDAPEEGIRHKEPNTAAFIRNRSLGNGTLYIAESRLSWVAADSNAQPKGFSLEYPAISLHAISRDQGSFHGPCLYLMVDGNLDVLLSGGGGDSLPPDPADDENEDDDVEVSTEVQFVPRDPLQLDQMYAAMSECQALHPDENVSDLSDDEEEFDGEEGDGETSVRFADADGDDEGEEYDVSAAEQMYGRHSQGNANGHNDNGHALTEIGYANGESVVNGAEPMDTGNDSSRIVTGNGNNPQFEDAPEQ